MKAAIYTLGCKVNHYESQVIAQLLTDAGYTLTDPKDAADVYVVNSCTVTAESDRKTRQIVRRLRRQNPDAAIVLTGCMPQAYPAEAAALMEADVVLGNRSNQKIVQALEDYFRAGERLLRTEAHESGDVFVPCAVRRFPDRTRAEIKIEDGCNRFCAYCAIPYARGRVRSKKCEDIAAESAELAAAGYREIVLVGINLSAYRDGEYDLYDAVLAASAPGSVLRVRLGSLEPDHLTADVVTRLAACEKLCPQFHISLQSGCDRTLRRMNRHYTTDEYRALCTLLRQSFADCTLTTDIMAGFPGETQTDHETSIAFAREIGFEKVHVFPFSPRSGTRAAEMNDPVPRAVREQRAGEIIKTMDEVRRAFLLRQIGRTLDVLPEEENRGFTANYTPVQILGDAPPSGEVVPVRISGVGKDCCIGEVVFNA